MLIGAGLAMLIDFVMLYWLFDSKVFPGQAPGRRASPRPRRSRPVTKAASGPRCSAPGTAVGLLGSWLGVPMSAFGVAFIGNVVALTMFGVGLLARGYSADVFGVDIAAHYIPHGLMIGAGLVALIQALVVVFRGRRRTPAESPGRRAHDVHPGRLHRRPRARPGSRPVRRGRRYCSRSRAD